MCTTLFTVKTWPANNHYLDASIAFSVFPIHLLFVCVCVCLVFSFLFSHSAFRKWDKDYPIRKEKI